MIFMTKIRLTGEMPPSMKWMMILIGMLFATYLYDITKLHLDPGKAPYLYLITGGIFMMIKGATMILGWDFEDKSQEIIEE